MYLLVLFKNGKEYEFNIESKESIEITDTEITVKERHGSESTITRSDVSMYYTSEKRLPRLTLLR